MTFTVALLILALGLLIGHRLYRPLATLKAWLRRRRYKWQVLRPWTPGPGIAPTQPRARRPTARRIQSSRAAPPHA